MAYFALPRKKKLAKACRPKLIPPSSAITGTLAPLLHLPSAGILSWD